MKQTILKFKDNINKDNAYLKYIEKVKKDPRFRDNITEKLISIEEKYYGYVFYDGFVHNQSYYIKNDLTNESINGKIDANVAYSSKDFTLNELKKTYPTELVENIAIPIINKKDLDNDFKEFVNKTLNELLISVCNKHNLKPTKKIHIDIAPIEEYTDLESTIYYEKVYEIHYRDSSRKNDYVAIISAVTLEFYKLEFVYSDLYLEYLKHYKKPIAYVPKDYMDYYYIDGFNTYIAMKNKLKYASEEDIYKKVKDNIDYLDYKQYKDYLYTGIFYFRIKKYLAKLSINTERLKRKIYLSFLTLKYNKDAGLFLYECIRLNLLPDNSLSNMLSILRDSYSLGSLDSKMHLYTHYSTALYFDEKYKKKYS